MKYIVNNFIDLGKKESIIIYNLESIFQYIYQQIPLDYDKMKKIYKHVQVSYKKTYHGLELIPNDTEDNIYVYKFNSKLKTLSFELSINDINTDLIKQIHEFISKKSPEKLYLKNIKKIKLINNNDFNKSNEEILELDYRLHFWPEYIIDGNNLSFHDLIISAYKIKSHKFNVFDEIFLGLDKDNFFISLNGNTKEITVVINFYHNSNYSKRWKKYFILD
uniref:Uncharacterized protein n=1 Tax=Borely moumouvirus TaxID=2712067 RepID=A0A6G6ADR9_9VIRU